MVEAQGFTLLCPVHQIGLRADDQTRAIEQVRPIGRQLSKQDGPLLGGRAPVDRGKVQQEDENTGSFHVAKKLMPEATTLARPLDEAGYVSHHELVIVGAHDAELWLQRREGIVSDLGSGGGQAGDQRALAGVREADEGDVGEEPQLEVEPPLLTRLALFAEPRRPKPVGQEPGVASPPLASSGGPPPVTLGAEIGLELTVERAHGRADGHWDLEIVAAAPVAPLALAVPSRRGPPVRVISKRQQGSHIAVGYQPDRTTITAISAVRATLGDMGLPAKGHATRTTVAPNRAQLRLIDKARHRPQDTTRWAGRPRVGPEPVRCREGQGPERSANQCDRARPRSTQDSTIVVVVVVVELVVVVGGGAVVDVVLLLVVEVDVVLVVDDVDPPPPPAVVDVVLLLVLDVGTVDVVVDGAVDVVVG